MNMPRPGSSALRVACAILLALALSACDQPPKTYQGWIEANLIFVAPDESGRLETLSVREGEQVAAGAPLFTLDDEIYRAELQLNDAQVENARQAYDRAKALLKSQVGTQKSFDEAEAAMRTARARLNTAQTRLARRKVASPVSGVVQQVYFRPGEMVSSGRPVLAILPPGNLKARFFVPETTLPRIAYGDVVQVRCDGCPGDIRARVTFISRSAEFTPPVIYSLEERAKLVFLIEAIPDRPEELRVGQPIDVALEATPEGRSRTTANGERPSHGRAQGAPQRQVADDEGPAAWVRSWALSLFGKAQQQAPP